MENNKTILQAVHDSAKSFYNKAYYTEDGVSTHTFFDLYSYGTRVASLEVGKNIEKLYNKKIIRLYLNHEKQDKKDFYSKTTIRHLKEFIKQITDDIRDNSEYSIVYYDKNKTLHLYSIEILRSATKKDLFKYALGYDF